MPSWPFDKYVLPGDSYFNIFLMLSNDAPWVLARHVEVALSDDFPEGLQAHILRDTCQLEQLDGSCLFRNARFLVRYAQ